MKITFLLPLTPNPRLSKRVRALQGRHDVLVIYWRRREEFLWGGALEGVREEEIYIKANLGRPTARLLQTVRFAARAVRKLAEERPDCIYVQNLDMLFIATLYGRLFRNKCRLVCEIADIHTILIQRQRGVARNLVQRGLRRLDRYLCRNIHLLVNTSEKYYECYYSKFVPEEKLLVIPNVPDRERFRDFKRKDGGTFTVGFIGGIQCKEELKLLIRAAKQCGVAVRIAGSALDDEIKELCAREHIYYHGNYNYDKEAAILYSQIDCVFAVYDTEDWNVRIALPNKLYEAILCELPILVARKTYLAEVVKKLGVGVSVRHDRYEDYVEVLRRLKNDAPYYHSLVEACRRNQDMLNLEMYHDKLIEKIETGGGRT